MWKLAEHSPDANERWCRLRAVEWGGLPTFLSQLFVPLLLIFLPLVPIVGAVLFCQIAWAFFRGRFVSVWFAYWATAVVGIVKWPLAAFSFVYLCTHGRVLAGIMCIVWTLDAGALAIFPHFDVDDLERKFMAALGRQPSVTNIYDVKVDDEALDNTCSYARNLASEPCLQMGKYRLDATINDIQGLRPVSPIEGAVLRQGLEFEGEQLFHAPPVQFMALEWEALLATVHGKIYKIAIQWSGPKTKAEELYRELLADCMARYGGENRERFEAQPPIRVFWKTSNGNMVIDRIFLGSTGIVNVFATSCKVRDFRRSKGMVGR
jgi:hypothetical protein